MDSIQMTPMVRQYNDIKSRHRDKILLFRVGDFYEMFFDDAKEAARVLNIALTSRNDMPMAGFPHHASSQYIQRLIAAGKKVAICEQLEDPSKAKGLVKRDIVSIVTPGTLIDENYLGKKQNNFLLSLYSEDGNIGLTFFDVSTGDLYSLSKNGGKSPSDTLRILQDEIEKFSPSEIIFNGKLKAEHGLFHELEGTGVLHEAFPEWYFGNFLDSDRFLVLPDGAAGDPLIKKSILGAFHYISETRGENPESDNTVLFKNLQVSLDSIHIISGKNTVELDDFTIRNLELVKNMQDGGKKYTLLDILDSTMTPMGGRLLRQWILMPLYDSKEIYERQNCIEAFFDNGMLVSEIRAVLEKISDIERLSSRIALRRVIPKELISLSFSLKQSLIIKSRLTREADLKHLGERLDDLSKICTLIDSSIIEEPSSTFGGDVIKAGFNEELDSIRAVMREGRDFILKLQESERIKTGISSLKIKYNNIFGYFIEISKANTDSVPGHYIRKQSLVNAERYTIPELSEHEAKINSASEKVMKLEEEIFNLVVEEISENSRLLQKLAHTVAIIDVYSNFALIARENDYTKPLINDGAEFYIKDGRHPVVEKYLGRNLFVPNDTLLDDEDNRIIILTGPNMAGKSTYLRQNALIALMAQVGSYVPAREARIGMVDRIFTRIGASDNLALGRSTFLVEMQEAANIIHGSSSKSLIIMDELGRGTSTYDGLSIAWSVIEYLHDHNTNTGRTLFATHYHELTRLGGKKGIRNYNIAVREYGDELIFLRRVIEGPSDRSYGIYVARLAGIPLEIIDRAKIILETLEAEGDKAGERIETIFDKKYRKPCERKSSSEIGLFADPSYKNVIDKIQNIDINRITPLEAIAFLAEIKKLV